MTPLHTKQLNRAQELVRKACSILRGVADELQDTPYRYTAGKLRYDIADNLDRYIDNSYRGINKCKTIEDLIQELETGSDLYTPLPESAFADEDPQ